MGVIIPPAARPFDRHIGRRIRQLRVIAGKSQAELGLILDLTFQQVQKYEKGHNRISVEKLWFLTRYFAVDIEYFFDGIEEIDQVSPAADPKSRENKRLRLEIGRLLQQIESRKLLCGVLTLLKSLFLAEKE